MPTGIASSIGKKMQQVIFTLPAESCLPCERHEWTELPELGHSPFQCNIITHQTSILGKFPGFRLCSESGSQWHEAWPRWSTSTTSSPVHRDVVSGHDSACASKSRYALVHTHLGWFSISWNWTRLIRRLCLTLRSPVSLLKQEQLILWIPWSKLKHTECIQGLS